MSNETIKNRVRLANCYVMAFEHLGWILTDGMDRVADPVLEVDYTHLDAGRAAGDTERFLGVGLMDAITELANDSRARLEDLLIQNGVTGFAILAVARAMDLPGADKALREYKQRAAQNARLWISSFSYARELKEIMDNDEGELQLADQLNQEARRLGDATRHARLANKERRATMLGGPERRTNTRRRRLD